MSTAFCSTTEAPRPGPKAPARFTAEVPRMVQKLVPGQGYGPKAPYALIIVCDVKS